VRLDSDPFEFKKVFSQAKTGEKNGLPQLASHPLSNAKLRDNFNQPIAANSSPPASERNISPTTFVPTFLTPLPYSSYAKQCPRAMPAPKLAPRPCHLTPWSARRAWQPYHSSGKPPLFSFRMPN
jgi:hypothetical protein